MQGKRLRQSGAVSCLCFPIFDQLHDVADIPEPIRNASGQVRRHANAAVDPGEIIPASVRRDHMDMVIDLLGMTGCQVVCTILRTSCQPRPRVRAKRGPRINCCGDPTSKSTEASSWIPACAG